MNWILETVLVGISAFVATNIDDLVILMLFFSQVNATFCRRHVVMGQYLGFLVLLLASVPGYLGGLVIPPQWLGLLGLLPIALGVYGLVQNDAEPSMIQGVAASDPATTKPWHGLKGYPFFPPQTYAVAGVTLANGGDNIGIYVPLFASSSLLQVITIALTFLGLVGVWCVVADRLTCHPAIARLLKRYGDRMMPFLLIGLGLYILLEHSS